MAIQKQGLSMISSTRTGLSLSAAGAVANTLVAELTRSTPPSVTRFAAAIVGAARPLGVLFYGSAARLLDNTAPERNAGAAAGAGSAENDADLSDSVLDFYVIVERQRDWPRGRVARIANALLPPNVEYHERSIDGRVMRAKVAILSLAQFRRLTRPDAFDTTVWARFSQPARLVWVRDAAAADAILRCVVRAVATAALWAAKLGPERGDAEQYWLGLFERTYAAELRVESSRRPASLLGGAEARYRRLLPLCWLAGDLPASADGAMLDPGLPTAMRPPASRRWRIRAGMGRPLNVARLIKASFTFAGGARYLVWKISRHTGVALTLTPFAERHPLLAAPGVVIRLMRAGVFRRKA